ncbi:YjcG family protein [Shouchella lonarensis]|uniref:Putative phosphoesterase SAMN05421737_105175 n=1 Tax=Shouchella lonarensis TaxID=1464122 RepID=A0A1G6IX51_9BACI|nr:YjcG family protein [Shouchella lonarensis]SDC10366.1 2'-5' RNA ligase [Shouchella lonarensis]
MNYGIVLFPSKKFQDTANAYRRRYDAHYANIPPHVTLKESFNFDEENLPLITRALRTIAKKHPPVVIDIYKVDTFYPQSTTIFYKIKENETLQSLNDALYTEPFPTEKEHSVFVPHVTIAQGLSKAEHADIIGQLTMTEVSHREEIDRMQLLYQLENGSWTVYETFLLEG